MVKKTNWGEVVAGKLTFTTDGKLDTEETTNTAFNFKGGALQNQKSKSISVIQSEQIKEQVLTVRSSTVKNLT